MLRRCSLKQLIAVQRSPECLCATLEQNAGLLSGGQEERSSSGGRCPLLGGLGCEPRRGGLGAQGVHQCISVLLHC